MEKNKVAILVANKSEEIETIVPLDLLRRAGLDVKLISLSDEKELTLSNGTKLICDSYLNEEQLNDYSVLVFPGGTGILEVDTKKIKNLIDYCKTNINNGNFLLCANCVAPTALVEWKVFDGVDAKLTCYPSVDLTKRLGSHYVNQRVVVDQNVITAGGPGCSAEFSFAIIQKLLGSSTAEKVKSDTIFK